MATANGQHSSFEIMTWSLIGVFVLALVGLLLIKKLNLRALAKIVRYDAERFYTNPENNQPVEFPSLSDPATVSLSVVIPAYNEQKRLPQMLNECVQSLEGRMKKEKSRFTYEIIVVDDGSSDNTSMVALDFSLRLTTERFRVLTLVKNRGKGGAIRLGVLSSRGELVLFADADGATKFSDVLHLEEAVGNKSGYEIAIGSRAHLESRAVAERSVFRNLLMWGFHCFVWIFGVRGLKDTQCGFKLFSRKAAALCFFNLHLERWAFDVELLYIANFFGIRVKEVAVNWQEMDGSKLVPVFSWIQMALDILRMRFSYILGLWAIDRSNECIETNRKD